MSTKIRLFNGECAIIDTEKLSFLKGFSWHKSSYGYAVNNKGQYMHRILLKAKREEICDHINRNRLDNRLKNLRICNWSESQQNKNYIYRKKTSRFYGVYWNKQSKSWRTRISIHKKIKEGGLFKSELEAAKKYDTLALEIYGNKARLNFLYL